jgi:hypothetical protein
VLLKSETLLWKSETLLCGVEVITTKPNNRHAEISLRAEHIYTEHIFLVHILELSLFLYNYLHQIASNSSY